MEAKEDHGKSSPADGDLGRLTGQIALSEDEPKMPHDPKDVPCNWCGEQSTRAIEQVKRIKNGFMGLSMYFYVCDEHVKVAEENKVLNPPRKPR